MSQSLTWLKNREQANNEKFSARARCSVRMGEQGMFLTEQNFNIVVVSNQSVFRHRSMVENYIVGSVQSYMGTRVGHVGKLEQHQA